MILLLLACHLPFHEFAGLRLALPEGARLSPAETSRAIEALQARGEPYGVTKVKATPEGFSVELPFDADLEAAGAALIATAELEFVLVDEPSSALIAQASSEDEAHALAPGLRVVPGCSGGAGWLVVGEPALVAANVTEATLRDDNWGGSEILLAFDEAGTARLGEITQSVGSRLLIRLDGACLSAPVIQTPILGGKAVISMGRASAERDRQEAEALARTLNAALPMPLTVADSFRVGKDR